MLERVGPLVILLSFSPDSCSCHALLVNGLARRLGGQDRVPRGMSVAPIQPSHYERLSGNLEGRFK